MKSKIFFLITLIFYLSCSNSNEEIIEDTISCDLNNELEIKNYLESTNNIIFKKTSSGLYYNIIEKGLGKNPNNISEIKIYYKLFFLNNELIDETENEGLKINIQYFIKGLQEGLTYLNEGGKGVFLMPSKLAFGCSGDFRGIVNPGTPLIIEVELLEVYN